MSLSTYSRPLATGIPLRDLHCVWPAL
jgi:hypothetical protein